MPKSTQESNTTTSFVRGSVAGLIEVAVNHPLFIMKQRAQQGVPLFSKGLYTGITTNAASMVPITAIQVGTNGVLKSLTSSPDAPMTSLWCSMGAGALSSIVAGPAELAITYKRSVNYPLIQCARQLAKSNLLFAGLMATAARDSCFTAGYLSVPPLLRESTMMAQMSPMQANIVANLVSGVSSALISHPMDTIKQYQQ